MAKGIHTSRIILFIFLVIIIILFIVFLYGIINPYVWKNWIGTNGLTSNGELIVQPKTLWDLVDLLLLPTIISLGGLLFNFSIQKSQEEKQAREKENTKKIEEERKQEALLQGYIDRLSNLMLDKELLTSPPQSAVRDVARTQTRVTIYRLSSGRKGLVIRFLYEAGLIKNAPCIISMAGVDLREANLKKTSLEASNLSHANFIRADLSRTKLKKAVFKQANFSQANLRLCNAQDAIFTRANMSNANLENSNFRDANLIKVNFSGANIKGADFRGAKLNGANFKDTNLSEAKF